MGSSPLSCTNPYEVVPITPRGRLGLFRRQGRRRFVWIPFFKFEIFLKLCYNISIVIEEKTNDFKRTN